MQVPSQSDVNAPVNIGSVVQVLKNANDADVQLPLLIPASNTVNSQIILAGGYKNIAIGMTSNQAVTLTVQRYLDLKGLIPQGSSFSLNFTAGQSATLNINDDKPFLSFTIAINNASANNAIISPFALVLQAN